MFLKKLHAVNSKKNNYTAFDYGQDIAFCVSINNRAADAHKILQNNPFTEKEKNFFSEEKEQLKEIMKTIFRENFPKNINLARRDIDYERAIQLRSIANELKKKLLEKVCLSSLIKISDSYKNKFVTIKSKGGVGATPVNSNLLYFLAKKGKKILGIDLDTQKNQIGNLEDNLKLYLEASNSPFEERIYDISITDPYSTDYESDFFSYLRKGKKKNNPDIFRFKRITVENTDTKEDKEDTTTNIKFDHESIISMMRLFISFARHINKYDAIIIDEGQMSDTLQGYYLYFIKNPIIFSYFADDQIKALCDKQDIPDKSAGIISLCMKLQKEYKINWQKYNLFFVINTTNIEDSVYYEKAKSNLDWIKDELKNIFRLEKTPEVILVPYTQALDQSKEHNQKNPTHSCPIIFAEKSKKENEAYENTIENISSVIEQTINTNSKE